MVLIVEDDKSVRRMLRFALKEAGFGVTEAATGSEALDQLDANNVDAVILDLGLPDRASGAVLKRLRATEQAKKDAPTWVTVSAMDPSEAELMYGQMGNELISKPYDPWQIIEQIETMLRASNGKKD